jgi:GDP-L-fucose synthase
MPCNAYGIGDNYNPKESHFLPSLIKKISDSINQNKKNIYMWGDGKVRRELIYADDVADASIFFLKKKTKDTIINIGTGIDRSINEYAKIIMKHFGVKLKIIHQKNKLIGTPRKLLDVSLAKKYGWKYKTSLKKGLSITIEDYLKKCSHK